MFLRRQVSQLVLMRPLRVQSLLLLRLVGLLLLRRQEQSHLVLLGYQQASQPQSDLRRRQEQSHLLLLGYQQASQPQSDLRRRLHQLERLRVQPTTTVIHTMTSAR